MLFRASITSTTIKDKEKLAEQLYVFLTQYVSARLRYESEDSKEDCIQDTIMFIIEKFNKLNSTQQLGKDFNYEKYFYNRARSYISYWIKKVKTDRLRYKEYIEYAIYLKAPERSLDEDLLDIRLLDKIVLEYNLPTSISQLVISRATNTLIDLGLTAIPLLVEVPKDLEELVDSISHTAVDEYLIETSKIHV